MRLPLTILFFSSLISASRAYADGDGDNNPIVVRRVPREGIAVAVETESRLRTDLSILQNHLRTLSSSQNNQVVELLPDVMIFERAVRCALDYDEFFSPKDVNRAVELLKEGIRRSEQLKSGNPEWINQRGLVVRGYISKIDRTVQPYGLVIPQTYAFDRATPTRCDLWFHGRGETLSEVNFLSERMKSRGQYAPDHTIVLHPYGRYSNAFKFAGETDVLEALEDVKRRYRIDEDRISVRGFSMGGAACWQFAVHYADQWFAANPGAGFSETSEFLNFFQKETLIPKPWEERLWNLYDCDQYSRNLTHCPTIAYSGENDIQKQAADVMQNALAAHNIQLRHIVGAGMGHRIDESSKTIIEASMNCLAKIGRQVPHSQTLQTHTLRYNTMHWMTIDGLNQHWQPASMRLTTTTAGNRNTLMAQVDIENVSAFSVRIPSGTFLPDLSETQNQGFHVVIEDRDVPGNAKRFDLQGSGPFSDGSASVQAYRNSNGEWLVGSPKATLRKQHGLQGPIDDAFMDSFVFVRPTGKARHALVDEWATAELERAIQHWRRHFRGDARVIDDVELTDDIIATANVVLWGDPVSNSVMAQLIKRLPIQWSDQSVVVGAQTFDASHHAPILIYPNPLNQRRYVVLNSSFTYRDYAYLNNARQVPMLPDWAVIDLRTPAGNVRPGKVVAADFFDEEWKVK